MSQLRRRTAELLEAHRPDDRLGKFIDAFLILLIIANVAAVIFETVEPWGTNHAVMFRYFELFSIAVFTVEYLARLWSCVEKPLDDDVSPRHSRLKWIFSPLGLIDLLAILPFYAMFLFAPASPESLLMLRIFRGLRLLRIFKLTRYSPAVGILLSVIRKEAAVLMVAVSVLFIMLVVASWGIYLLEHKVQPEHFSSIPLAMWWAVITLTTVGYGDVVPITNAGKAFAGVISLIGIGMMALPAAILASGFYREVHGRSQTYQRAVEMALSDGELTPNESAKLELLRDELGIDENDAIQTLLQARHTQYREGRCPHCGEPLGENH